MECIQVLHDASTDTAADIDVAVAGVRTLELVADAAGSEHGAAHGPVTVAWADARLEQ